MLTPEMRAALFDAVKNSDLNRVLDLLKQDPNAVHCVEANQTLLWCAVVHQQISITRMLLLRGAKMTLDADNRSMLEYALLQQNRELVQLLLDAGAETHSLPWSFLKRNLPPDIFQLIALYEPYDLYDFVEGFCGVVGGVLLLGYGLMPWLAALVVASIIGGIAVLGGMWQNQQIVELQQQKALQFSNFFQKAEQFQAVADRFMQYLNNHPEYATLFEKRDTVKKALKEEIADCTRHGFYSSASAKPIAPILEAWLQKHVPAPYLPAWVAPNLDSTHQETFLNIRSNEQYQAFRKARKMYDQAIDVRPEGPIQGMQAQERYDYLMQKRGVRA